MKYLIIILALLITSCNPFISKELRRKNKVNRKLEKFVKKFPEVLKKDTLIVNLDTTIVTNEVRVDTLVSTNFDTLEIIKDKFHLKLIKTTDTLIIDGGCDADTVYVNVIKKVPYNVVKPVQLTILDHISNWFSRFWWWLIIAFLLYIAYNKLLK
jgi:hypothetical protein